MFNKLNNNILVLVFVALFLVVAIMHWVKHTANDRNFRERLVDADTAKITAITMLPKGKSMPVTLKRSGNTWELVYNNKNYKTEKSAVNSILSGLTALKCERLVSSEKESWEQYEVTEEAGTTVSLESNGKTIATLVIGKLSYQQNSENVTTCARLKNETEVYAINGFVAMNFNQDINALRYKALGNGNFDNIQRITFTYPADSSFTLSQNIGKWNVNGKAVDSTKVYNYLQMIANVSGTQFADDNTILSKPLFSILVEGNGKNVFEIQVFSAALPDKFYITSTVNPGAMFIESKDGLVNQLFVAAKYLSKG